MGADKLEEGLEEKEKELNTLLHEEMILRTKQKELLTRLKREQALGIANIEMDIQECGPGNHAGETLRGIITAMKEEQNIK